MSHPAQLLPTRAGHRPVGWATIPRGGGVYNAGSIVIDALTVISGNSPENRHGC